MWYKGIIIEVKENYSIVLKEDSTVVRINSRESSKVGDTIIFLKEDIYIKESKKKSYSKFLVSIVAIAAVLALVVLPTIKNQTINSYALVSLDINPSIQFELDENKNITDIYGLNKDSKKLMLDKLRGMNLDEAIKDIKAMLEDANYKIKGNDAIVGFSFLTTSKNDKFEDEVKNIIRTNLSEVKIVYLQGNKNNAIKAKEKGISLGRYEINEDIEEDLEEQIESMSVEEILNHLDYKNRKYLNEEAIEELEDELEDRREEEFEKDNEKDSGYSDEDDDKDSDNYDDEEDND